MRRVAVKVTPKGSDPDDVTKEKDGLKKGEETSKVKTEEPDDDEDKEENTSRNGETTTPAENRAPEIAA